MGNRTRRDRHVEDLMDKAIECLDKSSSKIKKKYLFITGDLSRHPIALSIKSST